MYALATSVQFLMSICIYLLLVASVARLVLARPSSDGIERASDVLNLVGLWVVLEGLKHP